MLLGGEGDFAQALVEELLRSGLVLTEMLTSLLEDMSEDAFPGEENGAVLIEMIVGGDRSQSAASWF